MNPMKICSIFSRILPMISAALAHEFSSLLESCLSILKPLATVSVGYPWLFFDDMNEMLPLQSIVPEADASAVQRNGKGRSLLISLYTYKCPFNFKSTLDPLLANSTE